mmetsp:Transcript_39144/g.120990  ORF Transcript_39144/g.120990 Transcript_39144/m.120990 type:complete len:407 (-) Transcript_39144:53-1273(-)
MSGCMNRPKRHLLSPPFTSTSTLSGGRLGLEGGDLGLEGGHLGLERLVRRALRRLRVLDEVEALLLEPVVVGELGHVVADVVREDDDDALVLAEVLARLDDAVHGGARRAADEHPLVAVDHARVLERLGVGRLDPRRDEVAVAHVGHEVVADALDVVRDVRGGGVGVGEDRAERVDGDDADVGVDLLDALRDAGHRAARAGAAHDGVDLAAALAQDLVAGAVVVGAWVGDVAVLVEDVDRLGALLVHAPRDGDERVRVVVRHHRRADHLGAEHVEHALLLRGHLGRHRDDHLDAAGRGGHRHADAGVARGGLDEHVALLDAPLGLGLEDHLPADAVLDRAARVEELALGDDLALEAQHLGHVVEADARRVAHGIEDGAEDVGVAVRHRDRLRLSPEGHFRCRSHTR